MSRHHVVCRRSHPWLKKRVTATDSSDAEGDAKERQRRGVNWLSKCSPQSGLGEDHDKVAKNCRKPAVKMPFGSRSET